MIKYVFIDMDNTIAENITCDNIEFYDGLYLNKRPIKIVIEAIKTIYKDCKYIIVSKTNGSGRGMAEKQLWLNKYFPEVWFAMLINPDELKSTYIEKFIKSMHISKEECLIIDDKKSILQECKEHGIQGKYPQQIICDYESLQL